jgi:transglutaminase-like putative cysteine protease
MKQLDLPNRFTALLLATLLSLGAIGCLASAYDLPLAWIRVAGMCLTFAAVGAFFCCNRFTMVLGSLLLILAGRQLWLAGVAGQTEAVLYHISEILHKTYHTGYVIRWSDSIPTLTDATASFTAAGILIAFTGSVSITKNRSLPGLLMPLPLLAAGLLITNMAPDPLWLTVLLCGMLTVFLSRRIRLRNPERWVRLTLRGNLCVVLILALMWGIFPPSRYEAPDLSSIDQWLQEMLTTTNPTAPTLPWLPPVTSPPVIDPGSSGVNGAQRVNLRDVGYNTFSQRYAFQITTTDSGWHYLRQQHYGAYDGISWAPYLEEEHFAASPEFLSNQTHSASLVLHTANAWSQLLPYYVSADLVNGRLPSATALDRYTVHYQSLAADWASRWENLVGGTVSQHNWDVADVYLTLPESTLEGAKTHLDRMGWTADMSVTQVVHLIGNYVRGSAVYNLTTPKMPSELSDFALWFLDESEKGYCVHFASAATVLLRAAGIPARYVEGYLTDTSANVQRMVYQGNAHAWVEYFLPGLGWVILEATPGSTGPEPTEPPPTTEPTEPTEPIQTQPPTRPTLPQQTTQPTLPGTDPTEPTIPVVDPEPGPDLTRLWAALRIAAQALLLLAVVILQWRLRLRWLSHRLRKGNSTQQALARWRHSKWLAKLRKEKTPRELLELANKAKFSRDGLSHRELRQFDRYRAETIHILSHRNILMRFIYRILLAIY